jgi:hypothetical protein
MARAPVEGYRKSWLIEIVPGFDDEALRVTPMISKGANAIIPLHLRVALLAGLAMVANDAAATLKALRPNCGPFDQTSVHRRPRRASLTAASSTSPVVQCGAGLTLGTAASPPDQEKVLE